MSPRNRAAMMALRNVLVERKPSDLKVGYFTVLTIMADRNNSTITRKYFHLPRSRSFSLSLIIISVKEATRPAADGIGKPRNSLPPPLPAAAARQLKRGRR